ncbi:hypothetical protein [Nocardioides sp. zg-1228]|uniref:hypothetical protein n=1 Tax=Nocardioides sp. zg-1228 TaxID=2763008 RepID=UPI00164326B9|nr:hypothetical protein [Nocardioides sp. zg-1228]MBC2932838.1 hypothetical protein [Nocardioides sp. zg-1228]QSF56947.1 hypothetical protein JX575_15360 [Nocardioides sp. zg-1228]
MSSRRSVKQLLVGALVGVVVGGGLMAVTPAGAEVSSAVATQWKKVWKKELRPLADKRYRTKKQSDAAYQPKGSYEPAGSGYSKGESDARYAGAGASYTKAESDARYAAAPGLLRGVYLHQVAPGTTLLSQSVDFGFTLATPPEAHYIGVGAPVPAGCSGSVAAPNAAPGHLCVFESGSANVGGKDVFNPGTVTAGSAAYGATIVGSQTNSATTAWFRGTWAMRPGSPVVSAGFAASAPAAVNRGVEGDAAAP